MARSYQVGITGSCRNPRVLSALIDRAKELMDDGEFMAIDEWDAMNGGWTNGYKGEFDKFSSPPIDKLEEIHEYDPEWEEKENREAEKTFMADWKRMVERARANKAVPPEEHPS